MKKTLLTLILALCTLYMSGAPTASSILERTSDKITKARSITAEYTISSANAKDKGRIVLASGKFTLTSSTLRTWYDGLTLWTYSPELGEVNITHPTSEELMEINPFAIISTYKSVYDASLKGETPKGYYIVELTPKKKSQSTFAKATIEIDGVTYYPKNIILTLPDSSTIDIEVNSVVTGNMISQKTFVFDQSELPDAEIIDLR